MKELTELIKEYNEVNTKKRTMRVLVYEGFSLVEILVDENYTSYEDIQKSMEHENVIEFIKQQIKKEKETPFEYLEKVKYKGEKHHFVNYCNDGMCVIINKDGAITLKVSELEQF